MKKSLIAMVLLAALSLGGVVAAHMTIADTADRVVITQYDLTGDPRAADGLAVHRITELPGQLPMHWDTTFRVNGDAETRYAFRRPELWRESEARLDLYTATFNQGYGGLWEYPITDEDIQLRELCNAVAANTPAGETHTEILHLADYFDVLPLDINYHFHLTDENGDLNHCAIHSEDGRLWGSGMEDSSLEDPRLRFAQALLDSFRFPVPEDFTVEVSISRDEEGSIYDMGCSVLSNDISLQSQSISSRDWIYFIPFALDGESQPLMDYSGTPAGFGLYRLPASDPKDLTLDDLELVLPLDPDLQVTNLDITPDQSVLLLSTREKGRCVLRVLDAADGSLLQTLELDPGEPDSWNAVIAYDGFALLTLNEGYRVLEALPDGTYRPRFLAKPPDMSAYPNLGRWYDFTPAFDGQRLAILRGEGSEYGHMCSFSLMVYDDSGLHYVGHFENSLEAGYGWNEFYDKSVRPVRNGTSIRWE